MRAEHLPVEALARRPEAVHGARIGVQRPDRRAQNCLGRCRRRQTEAQVCGISHVS
ncbi:hypothetical protein RV134_10026 [Roseovarius sp. EC-HK134]|nr:hypothetical protein RV134_10026 [Roseovarius sp. EC-HK134]VVT33893.1 hypothetical protein RV420_50027 [Roseovarius sp. EC-SD190]